MEEEALSVKVAWLMGWRYLKLDGHRKGDEWWFASPAEQKKYLPEVIHDAKPESARFHISGGASGSLPDFENDLNACAELIDFLADRDWSCELNNFDGCNRIWTCAFRTYNAGLGYVHFGEDAKPATAICRAFVATMESVGRGLNSDDASGSKKSLKSCPKCKSRATKIVHASDDTIECQICGHMWPLP